MSVRDYLVDPNSVARDFRDILLRSSADGGHTWSVPVRVSDGPVGNEECFPAVAVDGSGRVHVAWYDRRDSPAFGNLANTYWAWSDDGGASFRPSTRVSTQSSRTQGSPRWTVGDHLGIAAEGEKVYVVWAHVPQLALSDIYGAVISDFPTPVLVSAFGAESVNGQTQVRWWASDVREVQEFRVHRATGRGEFAVVGQVAPTVDGAYRWTDAAVLPGTTYRYRLEVVRHQGEPLWQGPVELSVMAPAVRLAWRGAVPNPFANEVALELEAQFSGEVRIAVYDVAGHEVARLRPRREGERVGVRWDGRDARGRAVAPGVYLVRAEAGAVHVVQRVVRMR